MKKSWLLVACILSMGILVGCDGGSTKENAFSNRTSTVTEAVAESSVAGVGETLPAQENSGWWKKPNSVAASGSRFLFVGNSHTYVNDLPGILKELAAAGGYDVDVQEVTAGSYSLKQFSDSNDEYGSVVSENLNHESWDFVILQENTNNAVVGNSIKAMYPYARSLDEMIKKAGGQTTFLMTWSPKEGAGSFSREMVQSMLSESYVAIAKELDALLIPGGNLFSYALDREPNLELWGEDGQHADVEGTYLAACGAYALFFQETPVGNPYLHGLDEETARMLQEIAQEYML